jgi:hypothetical protein
LLSNLQHTNIFCAFLLKRVNSTLNLIRIVKFVIANKTNLGTLINTKVNSTDMTKQKLEMTTELEFENPTNI